MEETSLKGKIYRWLEHSEGWQGKMISFFIVFLVLISVLSLPFEMFLFFEKYKQILFRIEIFVVICFTIEYFLRIYVAPERLKYIFSLNGFIDLMSILPFYLAFIDTRILRLFRLARLARVFKIANMKAVKHSSHELQLFPDEHIEHFAQKHPLLFFIHLVPVLFWLVLGLVIYISFPSFIALQVCLGFVVLASIQFVYAWVHYSHDIIYLTNYRIIITHRELFRKQQHELYYKDIVDIKTFHPHIFAYLFGFGSIVIETSAGTRSFSIEQVAHHNEVSHYIDLKKRGIFPENKVAQN